MQFVIVFVVLALVVFFVTMPLRRRRSSEESQAGGAQHAVAAAAAARELEDLEAAREAKYREIRDAQLDHSTGKLSDADFDAVDTALRAEAIEILKALDRARARQDPE